MREIVAIWYRGAMYQLGRGRDFYGIWPAGVPGSQPFERWPLTHEGWYGAWSRFATIEAPGTIVPADQPAAVPAGQPGVAADRRTVPGAGTDLRTVPGAGTDPSTVPGAGTDLRPASVTGMDVPADPVAGTDWRPAPVAGLGPSTVPVSSPDPRPALIAARSVRAVIAATLLVLGVGVGIAGLFPGYIGGASLAQQPVQLVPHAIYLAVWSASTLLILLGGARLRTGALLGTGMSIVTFGFFFADAGEVIAGGSNVMGAGLGLGVTGWLACAAGSVMAFRLRPAGSLPPAGRPARPRGDAIESVLMLTLAALGAAIAFAPAWDSYTLRTSAGTTHSLTAGNAFANPGPVIAGDVAVMVALVAVVVAAASWRPVLRGAALLAGAIIPMAAQAISALVQVGEATSPAQFGISPGQAAQAGLTIGSGVTPAFWIYCAFVVALAALCARMLFRPRALGPDAAAPPRPVGRDATPPATSMFS